MAEAETEGEKCHGPKMKVMPSLDLSHSKDVNYSSPLSPKSPSSVFTKTHLEGSKSSIISAILLSQWDNILGPRIRHLWTNENQNNITLDILNHVATHTLSGEICRNPTESDVDTKFYVIKDKEVVVTAFVFGAMGLSDMAVHSLSVIVPHSQLNNFLHLHHLSLLWLTRFISKLRILLEKGPTSLAMSIFTSYLNNFILMLRSLRDGAVPHPVPLAETAFHPDHKVDESFLRKAVTSHLMTCGRSVVIGQSAKRINLIIATLALFLTPTERLCSRFVCEDDAWPYHPDLCVQGLLKETNGELKRPLQEVFLSRFPTSLVDVTTLEVRQSSACHEHAFHRHELLKEELRCVWLGNKETTVYPQRDLFRTFSDEPETIARNFMEELLLLHPASGVREAYIDQFLRTLDRKAMALLKYIESETNHGKTPIRQNQKKLKQDMSLTLPGDFNLVLATAEKLRPGIYSFVCGDPKVDSERMHNILNTF